MSFPQGYFTAAGNAALLTTVTPLPAMTTTMMTTSNDFASANAAPAAAANENPPTPAYDLDELVAMAAEIVAVPASSYSADAMTTPLLTTTTTTTPLVAAAAAATATPPPAVAPTRWTLPFPSRGVREGCRTVDDGIWWHGEPGSAVEPGFQAIICLLDRPVNLVPSLGLPLLDSYRHTVFLQRTDGPNEMFARWCDDEARDEQEAASGDYNRRTLRLRLGDYLDLLAKVQEEWWQTLESRLMSRARQLARLDQPVGILNKVRFRGHGIPYFQADITPRLAVKAELDSRSISGRRSSNRGGNGDNNGDGSGGCVQIQLEVVGEKFGPIKKMIIPLSSLTGLVFGCEVFIHDLRQKWLNSQQSVDDSPRRRRRKRANDDNDDNDDNGDEAPSPRKIIFPSPGGGDGKGGGSDNNSFSPSGRGKTSHHRQQQQHKERPDKKQQSATAARQCGNNKSSNNSSKDPRLYSKQQKRSNSSGSSPTTTTTMTTTTMTTTGAAKATMTTATTGSSHHRSNNSSTGGIKNSVDGSNHRRH